MGRLTMYPLSGGLTQIPIVGGLAMYPPLGGLTRGASLNSGHVYPDVQRWEKWTSGHVGLEVCSLV